MVKEVRESFLEGRGLYVLAIIIGVTFLILSFMFGISTEKERALPKIVSLSPSDHIFSFDSASWANQEFVLHSTSSMEYIETPWATIGGSNPGYLLDISLNVSSRGADEPQTVHFIYGDGTKWTGTGQGADENLAVSDTNTILLNMTDNYPYFIASWIYSSRAEPYIISASSISTVGGRNVVTLFEEVSPHICDEWDNAYRLQCFRYSTAGNFCTNKAKGDICHIGNISVTIGDVYVNGASKWAYVTIGGPSRIYSQNATLFEGDNITMNLAGSSYNVTLQTVSEYYPFIINNEPVHLTSSNFSMLSDGASLEITNFHLVVGIPGERSSFTINLSKELSLGMGEISLNRFYDSAGNYISIPDLSFEYGDISNDGVVNETDLGLIVDLLLGRTNLPAPGTDEFIKLDTNDDGQITSLDLDLLIDILLMKRAAPASGTPEFAAADSNGDGQITISDLNSFVDILLGRTRAPIGADEAKTADLNGDGQIAISDLNIMVDRILGRAALFPVQEPKLVIAENLRFSGATTDIYDSNVGDIINNLTFENNNGKIDFTANTSISEIKANPFKLYAGVLIRDKKIKVDTSVLPEFRNVPAKITFKNVTFRNPLVKHDGSSCSSAICTGGSKTGNTYTITVANFSEFELTEGPARCGDGFCDSGESCSNCAGDCGACGGGTTPGGTPSGSSTGSTCVPVWNCSWGPCVGGQQRYDCIKVNFRCPFNTSRPAAQTRSCGADVGCIAAWSCNWGECVNGEQSKTCIKTNAACSNNSGMPGTEKRDCAVPGKANYGWLWWVIPIIILVAAIAAGVILLLRYMKGKNEMVNTPISSVPVTAASESDMIVKAKALVSQFRQRNYTEKEIRDAFREKGWNDKDIDSIL